MRIATVILYLLSVAFYVYGATRRLSCNTSWMAGAAEGLVLVALFWFLLPLYFYLTAKRKMTVRVYRDASLLFKRLSLGCAACFGLAAAAVLISWILNPADSLPQMMSLAASFILGGLSMLSVYVLESRMKYIVTPSDNVGPEKGVKIRY